MGTRSECTILTPSILRKNRDGEVSLHLSPNVAREPNDAVDGLNLKVTSLELAGNVQLSRTVAFDRAVGKSGDDLDEIRHALVSETLRETTGLSRHDNVGGPAADQDDVADLVNEKVVNVDASRAEESGQVDRLGLRKSRR